MRKEEIEAMRIGNREIVINNNSIDKREKSIN